MPPLKTLSPVLDAERRAWNYWFVDGLPNLLAGLACLLLSGAYLLVLRYRFTHSLIAILVGVLLLGVFTFVLFRLRQTLEWLKSKVTYPRTGYAAAPYFTFQQNAPLPADLSMLNLSRAQQTRILPSAWETARELEDRNRLMWLTVAVYLAAMLCAQFLSTGWVCGALGMAVGLGIWLAARTSERHAWSVAFGLPYAGLFTFTIAAPYVRHFHIDRIAFFLSGAGVVLVLAGAIVLVRYLRDNPVARA